MNDLAIVTRFVSATVAAFVLALVVLPLHLALEAAGALGNEIRRVRNNW